MHNCIFTPHCIEAFCDKSCPILAETSYLLERNNLSMTSPVFNDSSISVDKLMTVLDRAQGGVGTLVVPDASSTVQYADALTYCAICRNWQGSRLHCNVYNLRYAKYLDDLKKSWSLKAEPEDLEYTRIWAETAKVLIVSNFDYVKFGDFESQTLLNLIQLRQSDDKTTIFVSPELSNLISPTGQGNLTSMSFFARLKAILTKGRSVVNGK